MGVVSVFLRRLVDSVAGIVITHKHPWETLFGTAGFKVGARRRITLTRTWLQRTFRGPCIAPCLGVVISGIYSALWHVFQMSHFFFSQSLSARGLHWVSNAKGVCVHVMRACVACVYLNPCVCMCAVQGLAIAHNFFTSVTMAVKQRSLRTHQTRPYRRRSKNNAVLSISPSALQSIGNRQPSEQGWGYLVKRPLGGV